MRVLAPRSILPAVLVAACATTAPSEPAPGGDGTQAPAGAGGPAAAAPADAPPVHHEIDVRLDPAAHRIVGIDRVTLPPAARTVPLRFRLHAGLEVAAADRAWEIRPVEDGTAKDVEETSLSLRVRTWEARRAGGGSAWPVQVPLTLRFEGAIHHPLVTGSQEYARSFSSTPGTIGEDGAVLSGATWWLPRFGEELVTFTLRANVPPEWDVVSQGRRTTHEIAVPFDADSSRGRRLVTWDCAHPMDEVYLIASKFTEYERPAGRGESGDVTAQAFLRTPDPALAAKYLEATAQYLAMYSKLLGPYPFEKFALVENFWETGYGMPSFTLLGPQVIRLPFILHSSYPHEILHNWWGNSVYVDWSKGNWCEGLTAYLADHLVREGQGRSAEYRMDALKGWRDYASAGKDFPLVEFRSRHDSATQAVGYGKSLMLWHMLRVRMGDERFVRALATFYSRHRFTKASWADIEREFSAVAGEDLKPFFEEWTTRTGALELKVGSVMGTHWNWSLELVQMQPGEPYTGVVVPLTVTYDDSPDAEIVRVTLTGAKTIATFDPKRRQVVRIDIDPEFDVFRTLDASETPPTLSEMFGAEKVTLIVPAKSAPLAAEWATFAQTWAAGGKDVQVVAEDAIDALPAGRAVWALGAANRFGPQFLAGLAPSGARVDSSEARFGVEFVPRAAHSFVYVARHPADAKLAAGWVGTDVAAAIPGLARKLPHYGKYSYLAFKGDAPDNVVKGVWPASESPLVHFVGQAMDTRPARGKLPPRPPLAKLSPVFDAARMAATVKFLSDEAQEGRGVGTAGHDRAKELVGRAFSDAGLSCDETGEVNGVTGQTWYQQFAEEKGPDGKPTTLWNVVGVIPGTNPALKDQCVVVGAHYDHLGRGWPDVREGNAGKIHPGADDNASGIAVMVEVARVLAPDLKPKRTLVFVAFDGEEWGLKGSRHFARTRSTAQRPFAMINLDAVGRLGAKKLLVLGAGTADEWRHIAMGIGFTTGVESTCVADDPGGSDQVAFHEIGVPAVQLFTGPHEDYHRPSDTADKVDYDGMVKVATWLREAVVYLADREAPLTVTLRTGAERAGPPEPANAGSSAPGASSEGGRRASLGTMPDFEFAGPGVRVASVIAGSPAEKAGIAAGDVLLAIDGADVADLKGYSALLKARKPGDIVKLRLRRGAETKEIEATLAAR